MENIGAKCEDLNIMYIAEHNILLKYFLYHGFYLRGKQGGTQYI